MPIKDIEKRRINARENQKRFRINNPIKIAITEARYYRTPKGRFNIYKKNSKKKGHYFNLNLIQFCEIIAKPCIYCGCEKANGIDRFGNEKFYSIENAVPCCYMCNMMKRSWSSMEFISHCIKISEHSKRKIQLPDLEPEMARI